MPFVRTPWRGRAIGFGSAGIASLAVVLFAPAWVSGTARAVAAYDAGAIALIAAFWLTGMHGNAAHTQVRAAVDDPGRNVVLAIVLLSVGIGLASAIVILGQGPHVHSVNEKAVVYTLGLVAIIAGWVLIHTTLTFRYAHLFYFDDDEDSEADRGLTFPGFPNRTTTTLRTSRSSSA